MKDTIIIIEATTTGAGLEVVRAAHKMEIPTYFITSNIKKYHSYNYDNILGMVNTIEVENSGDFEEVMKIIEEISLKNIVKGILSLTDSNIEVVAKLCESLGLTSISSQTAKLSRNKELTREALLKTEIAMPWCEVVASYEEAVSMAEKHGYPVILKDSRGTGSMRVEVCINESYSKEAFRKIKDQLPPTSKIIIEEYIVGTLVSVEALILNSKVIPLGITNRKLGPLPYFVEESYSFPVDMGGELESILFEANKKVLEGLGFTNGSAHVEFVISKGIPYLIEVNPRLGGGMIGPMINHSLGINVYEILIKMSMGHIHQNINIKNIGGASAHFIFSAKAGTISNIDLTLINKIEGIRQILIKKEVGDYVEPPIDYRGDIGHVYTASSNATLAEQICLTAKNHMVIEFELEKEMRA